MTNRKPTTTQWFVVTAEGEQLSGPHFSRLQWKKAMRRAKKITPNAKAGKFTAYHY